MVQAFNVLIAPLCIMVLIAVDYLRDGGTDPHRKSMFLSIIVLALCGMLAYFSVALQYYQRGPVARFGLYFMATAGIWLKAAAYFRTFVLLDFVLYKDPRRTRVINILNIVFSAAHLLLLVFNVKGKFFFHVSPVNSMVKGPYYQWQIFILLIPVLFAIADVIPLLKKRLRRALTHLCAFGLPTILASILDYLFETEVLWAALALMLLFAYLFIIRENAEKDSLTKVNNRRSLDEYLEELARNDRNVSHTFIMMDLNDFKSINDKYGHFEGDKALRIFSGAVQSSVRQQDFVARFGGDEFCVIAQGLEHPERLVRRIQSNLESLQQNNGVPYRIHFSYGCGVYKNNLGRTPQEFLRHVDELLYISKQKNHLKNHPESSKEPPGKPEN